MFVVVVVVRGICVGALRVTEGLEVVVESPAGFDVVVACVVEAETVDRNRNQFQAH